MDSIDIQKKGEREEISTEEKNIFVSTRRSVSQSVSQNTFSIAVSERSVDRSSGLFFGGIFFPFRHENKALFIFNY